MNATMEKIDQLRSVMVSAAEKHKLNLQHPEVIKASCELDKWIFKVMKSGVRARP